MRIVIDFDYTVFDTQAMREALINTCRDAEGYTRAEAELKKEGRLFTFEEHVRLMNVSEQVVQTMRNVLQDVSRFVYDDVMVFLDEYVEHELVMLTYGNPEWQRQKFEASGLKKYFDSVIYTDKAKELQKNLWETDERVIIINDKATEIDAVIEKYPSVEGVHIARPGTPYAGVTSMKAGSQFSTLNNFII